ncbi:hypothetical protein JKF63_02785 [Porcisia hertigi]|uniref:protein-tyrosine-phosphatase n=1 Tax=Porcisia hertigi TaxID=2761500 RepID=A0A836L4Z1_9TRYP|nr:hypothetical protein JKF63_02785 [Porcisia hertigi]
MRRSSGGGSALSLSVCETASPRLTPKLTPRSAHGGLVSGSLPDHVSGGGIAARKRHGPVSSPAPSPTPRPSSRTREPITAPVHHTKKKKGRPQNALYMLARGMGIGASGGIGSSQVVDLRALDPSPCPSRESRSPMLSGPGHPRDLRAEDVPATQILDFLYLGSVKDAQNAEFLAEHQIRYIINVSQEEYWSVDKKVQIFTFKVDDSATADIAALFQPTRDLINSVRARYYRYARGESSIRPAVLVHCQKGRSRSATIVLAYLIYTNGWSVAETMKYVGMRRPCAEPNIGFMEELRKLQESLSLEERTKRCSELCWFMRNLSPETAPSQVRELFEKRIGMVRHVVTRVVASSGSGSAAQRESVYSASVPAAPPIGDTDAAEPLVPFDVGVAPTRQGDGANGHRAATRRVTPVHKDVNAAADPGHPPETENTMLCFVFFTCREDVLLGIKSGLFKQLLRQLRPAVGKQIKYATGPQLKKIMTEHQSISSGFAQDMASFSDRITMPSVIQAVAADADGAVATQEVADATRKPAVPLRSA